MKKVLIIGYPYPFTQPRGGGGIRIFPLAKYLPEFNWKAVILTPPLLKNSGIQFRVVETPYRDILGLLKTLFGLDLNEDVKSQIKVRFGIASKKSLLDFVFTRIGEIINYPDAHKGWKPFALKAGNELLQHESMDAIISCAPVISHIIASNLKMNHKIPWIADFDDLWSQNHNYCYSFLRKFLDTRLEQKTLSQADALVTVSEPWAEKLRNLHKGKPAYAITHGFELESVNEPPIGLTTKFTITYTGSIRPTKQDPAKLFDALEDLISKGTASRGDIEVRFYGRKEPWLEKEIRQYGLSDIAKQCGTVPQEVALQRQRESQLLLLLDWDDLREKGLYTSKIFEYLGARRPILATGGSRDNVVQKLLDKTQAGVHAPTIEDIKDVLKKLYGEYKQTGKITYQGNTSEIDIYSLREMTRKFAEVLEWVASK